MSLSQSGMPSGIRRRFWILLALILCGWGVLIFRAYSIAVLHQAEYTRQGESSARLRYPLPAPRGRILDRDGVPLAWSERSFSLVRTDPAPLSNELLQELEVVLECRPPAAAPSPCIASRLKPGQVLVLDQVIRGGAPLKIVPIVERMTLADPQIQAAIGTVVERQGELFGASGIELQFDHVLRGTPGSFTVIVDRDRNWIPASWKLEQAAIPGEDVTIPRSLAELKGPIQ